jgi:hypothetical protein
MLATAGQEEKLSGMGWVMSAPIGGGLRPSLAAAAEKGHKGHMSKPAVEFKYKRDPLPWISARAAIAGTLRTLATTNRALVAS